jgi:hypothetical protein
MRQARWGIDPIVGFSADGYGYSAILPVQKLEKRRIQMIADIQYEHLI